MSSIGCPYCQHKLELKGAKAGKYAPRCPDCNGKFTLTIHHDGRTEATPIAGQTAQRMPGAASVTAPPRDALSQKPATTNLSQTVAPADARTKLAAQTQPSASPVSRAPSRIDQTALPPAATSAAGHVDGDGPSLPRFQTEIKVPSGGGDASHLENSTELTGRLGGYELRQKLGAGGMGAVYLARQVSLDRNVALKVLAESLAADPSFVSRFTREAYAAAQLQHHNVVQIYDIGSDRDIHFFSMEFVEGQTLHGVVTSEGKLDAEVAAGYTLQAARGLQFAHEHGMIHRDVKPENLLLNDQGIVKVADLGLVKRANTNDTALTGVPKAIKPGSSVHTTQFNVSMGTPAYMPPEQARDAARVDQRADIYSLGCTLYDLLVGHPPFSGTTAVEVITKHARDPITPPDRVVFDTPPILSQIVMKMLAKKPDDRYGSMTEVIHSLENYLGIDGSKPFSPKAENAKAIEYVAEQFDSSKWAGIRRLLMVGFYPLCALGAIIAALTASTVAMKIAVAGGFVGFAVLTTMIYQLTIGITQRTHVFRKVRQLALGSSVIDWLIWLIAAAAIGLLLYTFGLLASWIIFGIGAAIVALAFHFIVDGLVAAERERPLNQAEVMLKEMRVRGVDENQIRNFVCRFSGDRWEEFYEALFGYEAKMQARTLWGKGDRGKDRKKFGAWRDLLIAWIDRKMLLRKERRDQKHLARLEAKALAAKGVDQAAATKQAKKTAAKFVEKAHVLKEVSAKRAAETMAPSSTVKPAEIKVVHQLWQSGEMPDGDTEVEIADEDDAYIRHGYFRRRFGTPLDMVFGQPLRLLLALIMLSGFALWFNKNGSERVISELSTFNAKAVDPAADTSKSKAGPIKPIVNDNLVTARTVRLKNMLPLAVLDPLYDAIGSPTGGLAGLLLLIGAFFNGRLLGLGVLVGAGLALFGNTVAVPGLSLLGEPLRLYITAAVATAIVFGTIFFFRKPAA